MRVERAQATGVDVDWPRRVAVRDVTLQRPWVLLERDQRRSPDPARAALAARAGRIAPDAPPRRARPSVRCRHRAAARPSPSRSTISSSRTGAPATVDQRVTPPIALDTQRLTGRIDGLSTDPAAKPARLDMTGRVGADSILALRGTVGSLGGPLRLDMNAELRGFAVPRTNPYLVQQVAWEARAGLADHERALPDRRRCPRREDGHPAQSARGGAGRRRRRGAGAHRPAPRHHRRADEGSPRRHPAVAAGGRTAERSTLRHERGSLEHGAERGGQGDHGAGELDRPRPGRVGFADPAGGRRPHPIRAGLGHACGGSPGASGQAGGLSRAGARGAAVPHAGGVLAGPRGARRTTPARKTSRSP